MARPKKKHYEYVERLGRYRARIKDTDGKRVAIYGRTEAELEDKLAEARARIEALETEQAAHYVRDYAAEWLSIRTAAMHGKYAEQYTRNVNSYIIPALGDLKIAEVRPADCDKLMASVADKSESFCGKLAACTKSLFQSAVDEGLIQRNPASSVQRVGKKGAGKTALTKSQQDALLGTVKGLSIEPFVLLALRCGLRREEALALQWDCVHLEYPAHIEVRRALRWTVNHPTVSEELKTDAAKRSVPLSADMVKYLSTIRQDTGYVCSGDSPMTQAAFRRAWDKIHTRTARDGMKVGDKIRNRRIYITLDFDVTPHQLRHTFASDMIAAGVSPKAVQYIMGHTDPSFTLAVYTHLHEQSPAALQTAAAAYLNS